MVLGAIVVADKITDVAKTDAGQYTIKSASDVITTESGRKGILNTAKDAVDTAAGISRTALETGSDLSGRWLFNYTSPETKQDKALLAAVIEYKKYAGTEGISPEKKYWESIEKSSQDRRNPVNINMNKALETLSAVQRSAAQRSAVQRVPSTKYGGLMADSIEDAPQKSGGGGNRIQIAIMILSIIFIISLIYIALMSTGKIVNKDQSSAKNTIIASGVLILVLGFVNFINK